MRTFIKEYLNDPSKAISDARNRSIDRFHLDGFDENSIYAEISSPEFHLYEEIILSI